MIDRARRKLLMGTMAGAALAGAGPLARAQGAPAVGSQPFHYYVPFPAGGLSDIIARLVGEGLRKQFGQPVVVEPKPGAAGTLAVDTLKRAPIDGSTLLAVNNGFFSVAPFMYKLTWDPMQDLVPVALTGDAYMAMFVHPAVPANNLKELIAYAKANPGKLNYGSSGIGNVSHLCGEYLAKRAGIQLTHIPYKGTPAAVQATLAKEVDIMFGPEGAEHALTGKMKSISILGPRRWSKLPGVPTTDEQGLPNWAVRSWHGIVVSAKTPPDVVAKLNQVLSKIIAEPAIVERLQSLGLEPATQSLAELNERVRADRATFGQLIKDLGITGGEPT